MADIGEFEVVIDIANTMCGKCAETCKTVVEQNTITMLAAITLIIFCFYMTILYFKRLMGKQIKQEIITELIMLMNKKGKKEVKHK